MSKRTSKRTPGDINRILDLRKQGKSIRYIASIVGLSKSYVHEIIQKKCPVDKGSGVSGQSTRFNIHDYQISAKILEKPKGWAPELILSLRKHRFQSIQRNGWVEYYFALNDVSVHIGTDKIWFFPPKYNSTISAEDAKLHATQLFLEFIPKIERFLEISISKRPTVFFSIKRQHIAMLNDKIFDSLRSKGFSKATDEKGDLRLILDMSGGEKHIEATHPVYASDDIDRFDKFVCNVATGKFQDSIGNIKSKIVNLQKAVINLSSSSEGQPLSAQQQGQEGHKGVSSHSPTSPPDYIG